MDLTPQKNNKIQSHIVMNGTHGIISITMHARLHT
jgi:hypothetical protein